MESILEKFTDLKLDSKEKVGFSLKKSGFLYDSKFFDDQDDVNSYANVKKAFCRFKGGFRYTELKGRLLDEGEILKLKTCAQNIMLSEKDSFILGSSLELVDALVNNSLDNGLMFVNRNLDLIKNSKNQNVNYETILTNLISAKHNLKRILIVDWDRQHNTNLQKEFYSNSRVLKFSIHHSDSSDSNFDNVGFESGIGLNINVPVHGIKSGHSEYMAILYNLLLPIAYEFNPQLILISTNFDCVQSDNENIKLTPAVFSHYLNALSGLANGKICIFVNGENDSNLFGDCCLVSVQSLLGMPCNRMPSLKEPNINVVESIHNCLAVLRPYWCCLQYLNDNDEATSLKQFLEDVKPISQASTNTESKTNELDCELDEVTIMLNPSPARTCICSDDTMMLHYNLLDPHHPERPERIKSILNMLKEKKLYERCGQIPSRHATDEELFLCHEQNYIERLKTLKDKSNTELMELSRNRDSVYYNSDTYECASLATGCVLKVVDEVCSQNYLNGVSVCRPPGHHAHPDSCSGFCFFNSIAIAAKYAQNKYPHIKKVLILDFDIHHGNGTQEIFKKDDSVLFISLHRYDNGLFYPMNSKSNYDFIGEDTGLGYTINIPWNQSVAGDAEYTAAFLRIVMPVAYQFNPDLVLVSAGFDGATGDPLGGFNITPVGYAQMIQMISSLANGRMVLALEGGYNLNSISESMCSCVSILLGDQCPSQAPTIAKPQAYKSIKNVQNSLKSHWSCFKFDNRLPTCEFIKKSKSDKPKNVITEMPYTLRNRTKKNNQTTDEKKSNNSSAQNSPRSKEKESSTESVALELSVDTSKSAINMDELQTFIIDELTSYAVIPLTYCPHLNEVNLTYDVKQIDAHKSCSKCNDSNENWICLYCFECFCSRYVKGHMSEHFNETKHAMVLSFSDLSVWCYACDSYVDNSLLNNIKTAAYDSKFA